VPDTSKKLGLAFTQGQIQPNPSDFHTADAIYFIGKIKNKHEEISTKMKKYSLFKTPVVYPSLK